MKQQLAQQQYVTTQVGTADRLQLVIMLYDGAISFLGQAKEKMAARDAAGKGLLIGRALDIIAELNASLNFQAGRELATNLFHLYNFMTSHLTKANLNWDLAALEEVLVMLTQLRQAWVEVSHRTRRGEGEENGETGDATPRRNLGSLRV
ncbi:MAG: flagellar export chaperone FliS [Syntrophobacterales bacterium]|jgi:flagellar protein FliS